jgi:hypothetical protein
MKRRDGLILAGVALFLLWWLFAFGSYYAIQKPFTPAQASALLRTAWNLLTPALIGLIGAALGWRLLGPLKLALGSRLECLLWSLGVGLGALGLLILALGLAGVLQPMLSLALFGLVTVYALFEAGATLRRRRWRLFSAGPSLPAGLRFYLILMGGVALLIALAPPLGFDSLVYHLSGPRLYLEAGGIFHGRDLLHLNYPALTDMLYTLALAAAGEGAAAPLHWLYGLLAGAAVFAIGRRYFGRRAGVLGLAVWASAPMVFVLAGWAYNDLALAFYHALGALAVLRWREGRDRRWLILAGVSMGLAMGQKYTAAVGALALGVLILWDAWRGRLPARQIVWAGLAFAGPALLVVAPWLAKNWAFTGNPVYPFIFGGRFWDDFRSAWYNRPGSGIGWDLKELLILPWTAGIGLREGNAYDGQMGPLFLVLLPALLATPLWLRRRTRWPLAAGPLLWVAGALTLAWTAGVVGSRSLQQMRLLLPAVTLLSPLAGAAIEAADPRLPIRLSLRRLLIFSLALALIANATTFCLRAAAINPIPVLLGAETRQGFLERNLGYYAVAMAQLAETLPAESRVFFLYEPRGYYATRPAEPDAIVDHWARLTLRYAEAGDIAETLRREGYTHVLLYRLGMDFLRGDVVQAVSDRDVEMWTAFERGYLEEIEWPAEPAYALYALR